jgi:phosphotransferase system  glucose/maltose/N-acetylglucosamine-specific IIC component
MGLGLGLTTAPATESILSVLPPAKAGVGSAVNDATREVGGTLGVAVLGSIFTSLYAHHLTTTSFHALPTQVVSAAQDSVAAALATVGHAPGGGRAQQQLLDGVQTSFMSGFHIACIVAAGICLLGAASALLLPGRTRQPSIDASVLEPAAVPA